MRRLLKPKSIRTRISFVLLSCILLSHSVQAGLSRGFVQELGVVMPAGEIAVDLYNSSGTYIPYTPNELRAGIGAGEILISEQSLGFKALWQKNIAAYANLGISTDKNQEFFGETGLAYRLVAQAAMINITPVLRRVGNLTVWGGNAAMFMRTKLTPGLGELLFGGEIGAYDDGTDPFSAIGLRWLPREMVTADVILFGSGGAASNSTVFRTPAALRINISLK
ncbi:MAG: hypothetical protein OEZ47_00460 [Gammaproteobacteria bacterium]|nr:hypothetical protein [Gammaproteobacteria bacterium]